MLVVVGSCLADLFQVTMNKDVKHTSSDSTRVSQK